MPWNESEWSRSPSRNRSTSHASTYYPTTEDRPTRAGTLAQAFHLEMERLWDQSREPAISPLLEQYTGPAPTSEHREHFVPYSPPVPDSLKDPYRFLFADEEEVSRPTKATKMITNYVNITDSDRAQRVTVSEMEYNSALAEEEIYYRLNTFLDRQRYAMPLTRSENPFLTDAQRERMRSWQGIPPEEAKRSTITQVQSETSDIPTIESHSVQPEMQTDFAPVSQFASVQNLEHLEQELEGLQPSERHYRIMVEEEEHFNRTNAYHQYLHASSSLTAHWIHFSVMAPHYIGAMLMWLLEPLSRLEIVQRMATELEEMHAMNQTAESFQREGTFLQTLFGKVRRSISISEVQTRSDELPNTIQSMLWYYSTSPLEPSEAVTDADRLHNRMSSEARRVVAHHYSSRYQVLLERLLVRSEGIISRLRWEEDEAFQEIVSDMNHQRLLIVQKASDGPANRLLRRYFEVL